MLASSRHVDSKPRSGYESQICLHITDRNLEILNKIAKRAAINQRSTSAEILETLEKSLFLDAFKFLRLNHDKKLTRDFAVTDLEQKLIELFRLINDQKQAAVIEFLSDLSIEAGKIGNWWLDDGS